MTFDAFIAASYTGPSTAWDMQRAFNLFPEADESGNGKSPVALLGTPGLALFDTLPTSPVRGIWTGLADALPGSSATDLTFVVAGSKLYSVTSAGAHTLIGDVGDDAAHSPVTFVVNGSEIMIASAGLAWVYDASTLTQAFFNNGTGTVNTSGTAVTWVSGDQFDVSILQSGILISGQPYRISAFIDETHITLDNSAGTQSAATYTIYAGAGTVNTSGTAVTWSTGDNFTGLQGGSIVIGNVLYTIASVTDATHLVLYLSAGTQSNATFSAPLPVKAAMVAFLDGYGIALPPNSKIFYISSINAFKLWSTVDFGRKAAFPDNIASILTDHEELWLFGSETAEIWRNTGNADFPLQRDPGAIIVQGIRAPFTAVALANGVGWLGGDARGNLVAWRATGYQPTRVSTHGVETAWAAYTTNTDATAFPYTMRGHQFWVINFPAANATWVYDATAGQWHERGWWNGTTQDRVRYSSHGYAFGKHLVGDWSNGKLYELSETAYTDAGTAIHRYRTAPHLSNEELWTFYNQFRLSCQGGLTPTLSWSDDAASGTPTWHTEVTATGRYLGGTSQNSVWKRLGKARDRVFRVTITDAVQVALFAAYLDVEAGT